MRKFLKSLVFIGIYVVAIVWIARSVQAAPLLDAADHLEGGGFSAGLGAELLLSNPSSEGLEVRAKYGVTDNLNTQAILGIGSDHRKFRIGANNILAIFPDDEGQIGVSAVLGGLYLRREQRGTFVATAGPMLHKRWSDWAVPFNAFFAWPFGIELDSGRYFTGSQLVVGSILEWPALRLPLELGIGLGKMETYVAAGLMVNFGGAAESKKGSAWRRDEDEGRSRKVAAEEAPVYRGRRLPANRKQAPERENIPPPNQDGGYTTVE